jgi:hypothetical protein
LQEVVSEASTFGRSLVAVVAATIEAARGDHGSGAAESTADVLLRLEAATVVVDRIGPSWLRRTRCRES